MTPVTAGCVTVSHFPPEGDHINVRNNLELRRRAVARALRGANNDERDASRIRVLRDEVDVLRRRVDELSRQVESMRQQPVIPMLHQPIDEEPPAGRAVVPPVTPARISNQAFDILLGTA